MFIPATIIPPIGRGDNRPDILRPDDGGMERNVQQADDLRRVTDVGCLRA
jgi:hypothetical protein